MIISLIAAMDRNRLIGSENTLPWHLPADFKHFKEVTLGKPVIMGRKTFESIGRPLPGRKNIVVSRNGFQADGVESAASIADALNLVSNEDEVMIIGGANFYEQMIGRAQRMYLTHVDAACTGDAWFPEVNEEDWNVVDSFHVNADEKNNYSFDVITYERALANE